MMNVSELLVTLREETALRVYIRRMELLEQTPNILKARLHIAAELFVQVYRNDRFDTLNLVLIYNGQRLYGRDRLGGSWHRHNHDALDQHDFSPEGPGPGHYQSFSMKWKQRLRNLDCLKQSHTTG